MYLKRLNAICYAICIVCIVAGAVFSLALIWGDIENEFTWKGFLTIGVFFLGATFVLSLNKTAARSGAEEA